MKTIGLGLVIVMAMARSAPAQSPAASAADRKAVEQAALDYIEGIYLADPARIHRSVHPKLTKHGFWRDDAAKPYGAQQTMTFDQLVQLATTWNKEKKRDTSIKKVDVFEVLDQTAAAKVTASWGIDYLQLAKYEGQWKIINILWQAHPR